jgi:hypothetical protein
MRWSSRQADSQLVVSSPGPEAYTTCVDVNCGSIGSVNGYNEEKPDYPPTDSSEWTSGPGNRDQFCDVGFLDGART